MVSVPYIRHDDPKERFKDYYVDYQTPVMDPAAYTFVDLLLPYVIYPNDELNERAMKIRNKYFPGKAGGEIINEELRHNKEYILECRAFVVYLNQLSLFPVNADDEELIRDFEKLNGVTINIFTLNQEAYSEDCTKKLNELWNAIYITERPAKSLNKHNHIDLMFIKEQEGYSYNEKIKANLPTYRSHYIMFLNSIELATDQRRKNVHTLQCLRCKKHLGGGLEKQPNQCFTSTKRKMSVLIDPLHITSPTIEN